ncbi:hypothetical protein LX87_01380 [Larkinella arboricola]|uniref:Uncharacterized protein n=1 Tax=Larkinella arboricola TaxID=643671 RepID=A0A327XAH5_LARAB|nr:DUF6686 family protein [Larkinella arboricola]RAK03258.1 hypothetical protein LX87_01380 [Larkinella arboricola]
MINRDTCFITLTQNEHGEIYLCRGCKANLSFRFHNIFQIMSPDEFRQLFLHVESIDIDGFFSLPMPDSSGEPRRLYLGTTVEPLYFCFTRPELETLRSMLHTAMTRLNTLEKAWTDLN